MLMLAFATVLVALACGTDSDEVDGVTGATEQTGGGGGTGAKGKSLVIFFSRAGENYGVGVVERGNTAIMVDYIKELADVDVFEIVPETAYPEGYEDTKTIATAEFNNGTRPAIKTSIDNLADYQNIFIGGPIWWGRPPMIFRTFFEQHAGELNGKTVIPFGTHGGSGVGSYKTLIQEYYPQATILEALGISGSSIRSESSKTTVENWLKKLKLDKQSTAIKSIHTKSADTGKAYRLNGTPANSEQGFYIKSGKKYIGR